MCICLYNIISSNTSTQSKCHIENQMNIFFSVFWIAMKNKIYMMRKNGINWPKLRIFADVKNWGCCFVFFTGECWETKWLVMTVVRSVMKQTGRAGETYIQKEEERDDLKLIIFWFFLKGVNIELSFIASTNSESTKNKIIIGWM